MEQVTDLRKVNPTHYKDGDFITNGKNKMMVKLNGKFINVPLGSMPATKNFVTMDELDAYMKEHYPTVEKSESNG